VTGDIIKQFLVSLGFAVDQKSLGEFNKGIASATKRVTALYTSIKVMSAAVFYGISKVSEGFEQMGYEMRLISPTINKVLVLRQELLKAYSRAGVDIYKVVQQSVKFNMALEKTKYALKAMVEGVAAKFFPMLTKQMDLFRKRLYDNMPKIQERLTKFVKVLFAAFEATVILGDRVWSILSRVYDFFEKLHRATDGWSTVVIGIIAAWKALNLAFLASPLGMILAGLLAILTLYDDFMTFKEGGESLFDWTSALPTMEAFGAALKNILGIVSPLLTVVIELVKAFGALLKLDFSRAWDHLKLSLSGVVDVFRQLWETMKSVADLAGKTGEWIAGGILSLLGANPSPGLQAVAGATSAGGAPALGGPVSNQTNQRVQQQTSITVQSSADAGSVGKAVAGEQSKVNFDMFRNMKGAAR